ncbi:MAG: aminotransferase class IV [Bdellovibrio sp.]|nr:aminotransferase class IV [Bdellovibrio sp.]
MLRSDVLDTFVFKNKKIYLKKYHIERSFEAYQFLFSDFPLEKFQQVYDRLELELKSTVGEEQMVRLFFSEKEKGRNSYEIQNKVLLGDPVRLEIIASKMNPAGRGPQNFKWTDRDEWVALLKSKSADADDVIALNSLEQLTETSRFNLFFYNSASDLVFTPTLDSGCVNGVYRRYALSEKSIDLPTLGKKDLVEKDISVAELESAPHIYSLFVANSARGVLKACLTTKN